MSKNIENEGCRKTLISSDIVCFETMYPSWRRIRRSQTAQENSDFTSLKIYSLRFSRKRELIVPDLLQGFVPHTIWTISLHTIRAITNAGTITADISLARLQIGLSAAWMLLNSRENELLYSKMKNVENVDIVGHRMLRNHVSFMTSHPTIPNDSGRCRLYTTEDQHVCIETELAWRQNAAYTSLAHLQIGLSAARLRRNFKANELLYSKTKNAEKHWYRRT